MMWELFDWHLHTNAGYCQMKEALQPIHVQYSIDDDGASVGGSELRLITPRIYSARQFSIWTS
jgi:hypothetical protein